MPERIQPMTEFQRMASERAIALAREMEAAAAAAPDGMVVTRLESLLLGQGRENQRIMLEQMIQHTADEAVKKGGPQLPTTHASVATVPDANATKEHRRGIS